MATKKKFAADQEAMTRELAQVKAELLKLPNVVAVGIGLKETGGKITDEISFRVYVSKKQKDIPEHERIPDTIRGYKTDVLTPVVVRDRAAGDPCGTERRDQTTYRPLQAGISVGLAGTLGWFGRLGDDSVVLLTNKHVLYADGVSGQAPEHQGPTAQPQLGRVSNCCCCSCGSDNIIGQTIVGKRDAEVDVAIARINTDLAASISFRITNAATTEVLVPTGTERAVVGETVRKIGRRSGFTRGVVLHVGETADEPTDPDGSGTVRVRPDQLLVVPHADETYQLRNDSDTCVRAFSNQGDSGSVILNGDSEIVGLLHGGTWSEASVDVTFANHISNALDALSDLGHPIELIFPGRSERSEHHNPHSVASFDSDPNFWERVRDVNQDSLLRFLFERHYEEVLDLVNHNRAVTVVWHRHQGPTFVAALARASRVAHYRVPAEIEGVSRESLLNAMETTLLEHGSAALQRDIHRYRDDLVRVAVSGSTVEDMAGLFLDCGFLDALPSTITRAAS